MEKETISSIEILTRIIENEKQALELLPVINGNTIRNSHISEINPKVLIDYCKLNEMKPPTLASYQDKLHTSVDLVNSMYIFLSTTEVKKVTTYDYES